MSIMILNPINKETHPFCHQGFQYAIDVLEGRIVACVYVIGSCKRFIDDYEKSKLAVYAYYLELDRAERYLRLVQKFEHVKGTWTTPTVTYDPWQNFIFMNVIGWRWKENNFPRFRVAHIEVARGQGKSVLASQAALYFLALDKPVGNEISCFANKSDQARIVLDSARAMAKKNKAYLKKTGVEVLAHKIVHEDSNSFVRAMSSDDKGMDGLNDILAICDELHVMSRDLFNVITSGMSKRRDSLTLCITTAGFNTDSVGYTQSQYAKKLCLGEVSDDQMFAVVYTLDKNDNMYDESVWIKANPSYGVSVDPITMRAKAEKCKSTPADVPNFKVKHLNIWISEAHAYYNLRDWDELYDPELNFEKMKGKKSYVGIDLASKVDLTCDIHVFRENGIYSVICNSYLPEETLKESENDIYTTAAETGYLTVTNGSSISYPKIEENLKKANEDFDVLAFHFDPWNAAQLAQRMQEEHLNMVEFRMNTANLSEATKMVDALIREKKLRHDGNPLLKWCLSNVVCKPDAADNVFPRKNEDRLKIDLAVGLIMAIAGWIQEKDQGSVYEDRGFLIM